MHRCKWSGLLYRAAQLLLDAFQACIQWADQSIASSSGFDKHDRELADGRMRTRHTGWGDEREVATAAMPA